MKICFAVLFLFLSFFLQGEGVIKGQSWEQINTFIIENYRVPDINVFHKDINDLIYVEFMELFSDYDHFTQDALDQRAYNIFRNFYHYVNPGMIEDSTDFRRQMVRAAYCFTSLGMCSEYNYSYYLDQALLYLSSSKGRPVDFLEREFAVQILVNIGVYNRKFSESGVRRSLHEFFAYYESVPEPDDTLIEINLLLKGGICSFGAMG